MSSSYGRGHYPRWVAVVLWGSSNRAAAWAFALIAAMAGISCALYAARFGDARWYAGLALLPAAAWYGLAIRWVDRNGGWQ